MLRTWVACIALCLILPAMAAEPGPALAQRLAETRAANMDAILAAQFERAPAGADTRVINPYDAASQQTVNTWYQNAGTGVCAVRFIDAEKVAYELRDFDSPEQAADAEYIVTHHGRCGSCSSLQDLAVYLEMTDLTTPARQCARKWGFDRVRACMVERIGLTPACAESWAWNARNTRRECRSACVETYGLLNLLLHRYPAPNNQEDGSLNACLQCDEDRSGPGFRYSAGRTRRNSGISSAILRPEHALAPLDHSTYFDD